MKLSIDVCGDRHSQATTSKKLESASKLTPGEPQGTRCMRAGGRLQRHVLTWSYEVLQALQVAAPPATAPPFAKEAIPWAYHG
jgi:hypothetical protein